MSRHKSIHTSESLYVSQAQAAREIGVSATWLCLRREHPLFRPALRLGDDGTPRYHREQIRLWLAVAAGHMTGPVAIEEWELIHRSIGRRPTTVLARTDDHADQPLPRRSPDRRRTAARHSPVGAGLSQEEAHVR